MNKNKYVTVVIIALSLFLIAATNGKQPVGEQINLMGGPDIVYIDASEPFHVQHGYSCGYCKELAEYGLWGYKCAAGLVPFTLALDGEDIHFSYLESFSVNDVLIEGYLFRFKHYLWTFNFPDGLEAGTYELTGTWHNICENVYEDCDKPLERVIIDEKTVTLIVE